MEGEYEDIGCGTWVIVILLSLVVFSKLSLSKRLVFFFSLSICHEWYAHLLSHG